MINSTSTLPQFGDLVNRTFTNLPKTLKNQMRDAKFVITDAIAHGNGDYRRYAQDLSRTRYAGIRAEGNTSGQGVLQYGYEKDAHPYTVSQQFSITKRMKEAGKMNMVHRTVRNIGSIWPDTIDLDLSHRLTFAWSTSYSRTAGGNGAVTIDTTVGDGLALINTAHTLTGSATTYSTQITGNPQFSEGALETALKSFVEETYDNLGVKMAVYPDCIITTDDPNTCNEVAKLMKATADTGTSNSGTHNPFWPWGEWSFMHYKLNKLATDANGAPDTTKRKYWFVCDSSISDFYFVPFNEPQLTSDIQFSSGNEDYLVEADYDAVIVSATGWRGSKGDGS